MEKIVAANEKEPKRCKVNEKLHPTVAAISEFLLSDNVTVSYKSTDFNATSSILYNSFKEFRMACIYWMLVISKKDYAKRVIKAALGIKVYIKALIHIGIDPKYIVKHSHLPKVRMFYGAHIKQSYLFGVKISLLTLIPSAKDIMEAYILMKKIINPVIVDESNQT